MSDEVVLSEYNHTWPMDYLHELQAIAKLLPLEEIVDIQHIGSTAVPGLAAKPIIDILVGFRSFAFAETQVHALDALHYEYVESLSVPGGRLFLKMEPRIRHIHFVEYGTEHWELPIRFRNYIRVHREDRLAYEALKRRNAEQFRHHRAGYTQAKTAFVLGVLEKAALAEKPHSE